jgi:carboxymethylenebutenolidase
MTRNDEYRYDTRTVDVDGSAMEVLLFTPRDDGPHPGLILAQHIPVGHAGLERDTFTLAAAQRFADQGYVVAVPFLFHWWPRDADISVKRAESTDARMVADVRAAHALLAERPDVRAEAIGIAGHCWGGRVAWLAACNLPLRACAIFYGGRIKIAMGGDVAPIALAAQIRCPVIGFFGNDDQNPTPADVNDYGAALETAGVRYQFHRYDGAGHAFQNFPSEDRYRHEQSEDAWTKVLAFFAAELKHRG